MRRLLPAALLVTLAMGLFPARADAYIWHWIDDLSGPQFLGLSAEIKFFCVVEDAGTRHSLVKWVERDLERYATGDPTSQWVQRAIERAESAKSDLMAATGGTPSTRVKLMQTALRKIAWSEVVFRGAQSRDPRLLDATVQSFAENPPAPTPLSRKQQVGLASVGGGSASTCGYLPLQRNRFYLSAIGGLGWDTKDSNKSQHNRVLEEAIGANWVQWSSLTFGAGAGVATFSSRNTTTPDLRQQAQVPFWYGQVDVRPGALVPSAYARGPWWQAVYVRLRYQQFTDPIPGGTFGGTSPRYERERARSIGIWLDTEPIWRHYVRHTWQ